MNSTLLFLVILIAFLAFVFAKTKSKGKSIHKDFRQFNGDGRRKGFKDFERERRAHDGEFQVFELGGLGVTKSKNRSEDFFKASGEFSDRLITDDPRGIFGEAVMTALVARVCETDKRRYVLMRNLYIPTKKGYTEIDTLLLHQSGIYVLESKNIAGEIYGTLEMERWKQHMNSHTEHTFHNPIKQNIGHILALLHHLKIRRENAHFVSVIVFSDRCVLKQVPANNAHWSIVHCSELKDSLQSLIAKRKTIYTMKQLEEMYYALEPCAHISESAKEEHRKYIKTTYPKN